MVSRTVDHWLAFGRLNRVLGLDAACVLPAHPQQAGRQDEVPREVAAQPARPPIGVER